MHDPPPPPHPLPAPHRHPPPLLLNTTYQIRVGFFAPLKRSRYLSVQAQRINAMNVPVSVSSSSTTSPVLLRAMIANMSSKSQVSKRLAQKLGLWDSARTAYVKSAYGPQEWVGKWKVCVQPVVVAVTGLAPLELFPLINCNEGDAWWEMIIGNDCAGINNLMSIGIQIAMQQRQNRPRGGAAATDGTAGPAFQHGVMFMGHNISMCSAADFPGGAVPDDERSELPKDIAALLSQYKHVFDKA